MEVIILLSKVKTIDLIQISYKVARDSKEARANKVLHPIVKEVNATETKVTNRSL